MLSSIQRRIQEQLSRGKHLMLALIVTMENAHPSLLTLLSGLVLYQTPCSWRSVPEDISELAEIDGISKEMTVWGPSLWCRL